MSVTLDSPIPDLASAVARGDVSAVELTRAALDRIEQQRDLHAFLHVSGDAALESAKAGKRVRPSTTLRRK